MARFLVVASCLVAAVRGQAACPDWAAMGECNANPSFMLQECAAACHVVAGSFYDLSAVTADGSTLDFASLEGRPVVITNVASYCGRTDEAYEALVELDAAFGSRARILAFPCNQFGAQEPEQCGAVKTNMARKYGARFQFMDKVDVNGPATHDVYTYLKHRTGAAINWNFDAYFVVDAQGIVEAHRDVHALPRVLDSKLRAAEL